MSTAALRLLALTALLSSTGCCTIGRYFCGPDDSAWVDVAFETPDQTLATFREAFAKDDAVRLAFCLSERLKQDWNVTALELRLLKDQLAEQVPGIHMIGHAEVVERHVQTRDRVRCRLEVAGRSIALTMVRQPFWELLVQDRGDPFRAAAHAGEWLVDRSRVAEIAWIRAGDGISEVSLRLPPADLVDFDPADIQRAAFGFQWKIDEFEIQNDA